ncbi:Lrp/AsnC family transcriptional regulator [Shewanella eurypsychrophilus]|uniref:Lrp/AsnC family transcriptional regulator n=1 Tax=Shewanella eurypsychrophilus TaxID=2593656 RepID=A0ABX6V2K8_9GAMM|nr:MULTISPECIES: Lrp/AsnC family transcriptional regulator [Shewanella]QFU20642.1 AsnC family transcriptional regulator [Shewanella sp. YLB-09]QFU20922.1 AsnC family transcriptional regulator [Shewanella sp. YLB-09]QPG56210.1 Lrp/AsnC family transcriptional regulator [Shewanella eurypsychrophilus]
MDKLDKFDKAIIAELRIDARQSISYISEAVNLSRSAVSERIKKLENTGIIRGYQVLLSESQKEGVSAYFEIQHRCPRCADVVHVFQAIPEVITCRGITGDMDLLVYVQASSMKRLHEIREHIDAQTDIIKLKTHVVMSEWIDNRG